MYLHLGQDTVVRSKEVVGIFDLENASLSKFTRDFLAENTKADAVINVSMEMPKSFVLCQDEQNKKSTVYISQISSRTLLKRAEEDWENNLGDPE